MAKGKKKDEKPTEITPEEALGEDNIFEHFGMEAGGPTEEAGKEKTPKKDEVTVEGLGKEVSGLVGQLEEQKAQLERLQTMNMQLLSGAGGALSTPEAPQMPKVDLSGLPDIAEDPEGYTKGLNERLGAAIEKGISTMAEHQGKVASAERAQSDRTTGLWDQFTEQYPDLEGQEDFVEVAAGRVARRAQRRGLNVDTYMFRTTDQFLSDVEAETRKIMGPLAEKEGDEKEGKGDKDTHVTPEEIAASRTGGIFGGTAGQTEMGSGKGADSPKGGLLDDLTTIQRKSGFY
jgi:hypothetical protein